MLERLGSRLNLLRGGARDLPARQQTLRDTIGWSYELLNTGEQRLFALLSVFSGCTLPAVEAVASGIKRPDETQPDLLDGLASLVDKSLLQQVDPGTGEPRLLMLETIREYAAERLEEDPELSAAARRAHAGYFADFTERRWARLTGHEREAALAELEGEIENVRAAWRYWVADKESRAAPQIYRLPVAALRCARVVLCHGRSDCRCAERPCHHSIHAGACARRDLVTD